MNHNPRNVRNFWVDARCDGYKVKQSFGPKSKDGGINITIYQRSKGQVKTALIINGYLEYQQGDTSGDEILQLDIMRSDGLESSGLESSPNNVDRIRIRTER